MNLLNNNVSIYASCTASDNRYQPPSPLNRSIHRCEHDGSDVHAVKIEKGRYPTTQGDGEEGRQRQRSRKRRLCSPARRQYDRRGGEKYTAGTVTSARHRDARGDRRSESLWHGPPLNIRILDRPLTAPALWCYPPDTHGTAPRCCDAVARNAAGGRQH